MAKDQGITRVVVVVVPAVLFHLSHFLIKRKLSEKNYPKPGFKLVFEKLKDFKNHAADLAPVLVIVLF